MLLGEKITVIGSDYSYIHGIVTEIINGYSDTRFKVDGKPKYIYKINKNDIEKEMLFTTHDILFNVVGKGIGGL